MKKVLLFNHGSSYGGSGVAFLNIIDSMKDLDCEIVVYCAANTPEIADALEQRGIRTLRAYGSPVSIMHYSGNEHSAISPSFIKNILKIQIDKRNIEKVIVQEKPDLIIVNSMTLCWIGILAKKYGVKTICFDRETFSKGLIGVRTKIIKSILDRYFDCIIFISDYDMKDAALKHADGLVINDSIELGKFSETDKDECRKEFGLTNDYFYILFLGGISLLKGTDTLLQAVETCRNDNIRCVILGGNQLLVESISSSEKRKIAQIYNNLEHKERFLLLPSSQCVEKWYAACDMVVFPSSFAHQAMPIYEAGAAKRPILISDFPNTREFLKDGVNGMTFKPGDAGELTSKIDYIVDHINDAEISNMIQNNYVACIENHDLEQFKNRIGITIKKMLS